MSDAIDFNKRQLAAGKLTAEHVTMLVRHWQRTHELDDDAKAGPITINSIEKTIPGAFGLPPAEVVWPMRMLGDGRKPTITSGFRNPDRKNHSGADIMYPYKAGTDPAMKVGDGGRTARWWVPANSLVCSVAAGVVEIAGKTPTGWRVWVRHEGGFATGYFHLTQLFARVGDAVELGGSLGICGDNPVDHDPVHLHFELVRGDLANRIANLMDPAFFLKVAKYLEAA